MRQAACFAAPWMMFLACAAAHAASPQLGGVTPRGIQRGEPASLFLHGDRLADAREILFYSPGIAVDELKVHDAKKVEAIVRVAADCRLGEHCLRLRTATGVTQLRTFWVGQFPSVAEQEPNSDFEQPQAIAMNVTVSGVVTNEDVDYYVVEVEQGRRVSVEIEAMRLGEAMFDPYVAILDAKRFELAACDDSALLLQDSVASIMAPQAGRYLIQVRESAYGGSGGCRYRLHVGSFPRPLAVYPSGGQAGETLEVSLVGDPAGTFTQAVELPQTTGEVFELFASRDGLEAASANLLRVCAFANVLESEPNDAAGQATATQLELPLAFNGILEKSADEDWFRFTAKKDQQFDVRVQGRALRSPLDSVISIHAADGKQLAHNDDAGGPDSAVRFKFPGDGEYLLRVRDHLNKGGPLYVYRVEFSPILPRLTVNIPRFGRDSQARQTISVPRGNRTATLLTAKRDDFGGDLVYEAADLPQGVTMHAEKVPSNLRQQPVVFKAAADAPVEGRLVDLRVRHADAERKIEGGFSQTIELVQAAPNNTVYYRRHVDRVAVAVVEEAPFHVDLVEPKVPLVQNGSMNLRVKATRKEGFVDPINVRLLWKPPGVGARATVEMGKASNEVLYPINAEGGARTETWKIVVLGESAGFLVASEPTALTVAAPFIGMKIEMTVLEQGESGQVVCKLEQKRAFEGKAQVKLLGLPPHVKTEDLEITKDDAELVFDVTTQPNTPAGKHKGLFCRIVPVQEDEPIVHNLGHGGVLRIDKPPPAPKEQPKKAEAAPKAKPKQVKRLTRLERLRLEAKERAETVQ
jgi:hypothetical protein